MRCDHAVPLWKGEVDRRLIPFVVLALLASVTIVRADTSAMADTSELAGGGDLTELSLEDLLKIDVISVSKHSERLASAAAAVSVVTGEEIRRSGARSIAESLPLVPGMDVARKNANTYSISARGFQSAGDKLQVLVDGLSVYTPLTSAVFWDVLDVVMPDIDRIEVIRGPGATLWGSNAVNGVINIITKSSADTRGGPVHAGIGNELREFGAVRGGTTIGQVGDARFYAQAFDLDDAKLPSGAAAHDGQRQVQGGLRSDWRLSESQQASLSGDLYAGREHSVGAESKQPVEASLNGANLSGRWSIATGARCSASVMFTYDHYRRSISETYSEQRDTADFGIQHQTWIGDHNEIVYGAGYRYTRDRTGGPPLAIIFLPASRALQTWSAFAQDQIYFGPDVVWTLGSKFEHNDFTGYEIEPGTRLGWQLNETWFSWGAVSRAVRTPNRIDSDIAIFCTPPSGFTGLCAPNTTLSIGNPALRSEKLLAYEWGLRYLGSRVWSADLSSFYNDYRNPLSTETTPPFGFMLSNKLKAHGAGGEASLNWRPYRTPDLKAWYSLLAVGDHAVAGSADANGPTTDSGDSPRHQLGLVVSWQPLPDWYLNGSLRYVDKIHQASSPSATSGSVTGPGYAELNLRAAWRLWTALELGLAGENLIHVRHPEYGSESSRSELQRAVLFDVALT